MKKLTIEQALYIARLIHHIKLKRAATIPETLKHDASVRHTD